MSALPALAPLDALASDLEIGGIFFYQAGSGTQMAQQRRGSRAVLAALLLVLSTGLVGCGGPGPNSGAGPGQMPGAGNSGADVLVRIDSGWIAGTKIGDPAAPVRIFRGIPYAEPPLGKRRWQAPERVTPWSGIREATAFTPWAAQPYPSPAIFEVATDADMSEDVLYLNVITPARRADAALPVLVWFHGGGLDILSGNMLRYNTADLAAQGAVVVTVNHRLGPLGYLAHPWLSAESAQGVSGNYGQLDLIASLEWVQRNIAAFGGDPQRVTIFGQSGGGRKVNFLMVSPLVPPGLFHRAISVSGSIHSISRQEAEAQGEALVAALGVSDLAALRAVPWRELVAAATQVGYSAQFVEDGWSLLGPITQGFAHGIQQDVPFMAGMVGSEGKTHFYMPVQLLPTMTQRSAPVYAYKFDAIPAGWREAGAVGWHAIEVAYLFSDPDTAFGELSPAAMHYYLGSQGVTQTDPGVTDADRQLALDFKRLLVRFAATGNPNVPGLVTWPAYRPETDEYLVLDTPLRVASGYSQLVHPADQPPAE